MANGHHPSTALATSSHGPPARRSGTGWLVERLRRGLGSVPLRIELWNGAVTTNSIEPPRATVSIRSLPTLVRLAVSPVRYFGEAYRSGNVEVHGDLVGALVTLFERCRPAQPRSGSTPRSRAELRRARRSARQHYDLGNDFYRLWLDEQMVYTCGYFPSPDLGLEQAQVAKMDYVCRKLRLRPNDRVLEAGCGWGALARHMALNYGARVTACNVSGEQIRYARAWADREGFGDRVNYVEDDFRNVDGTYDVFVSVGMLEHVGRKNYADLGRLIHERLDPDHGRGLLHFIGRNRPLALDAWIRRRIFPDAYPPAVGEVLAGVLEPWDFSVLDVENLRLHYARTLAHWLARFENNAGLVAKMFDEAFVRSWRLYLASSQAAFQSGWLQLFQLSFARGRDNDVPWTRAELYGGERLGAV